MTAVILSLATSAGASATPVFRGMVLDSDDDTHIGLCEFDASGNFRRITDKVKGSTHGNGMLIGRTYYSLYTEGGMGWHKNYFGAWSTTGWDRTNLWEVPDAKFPYTIAAADDTYAYGCYPHMDEDNWPDGYQLGKTRIGEWEVEVIAPLESQWYSIAVSGDDIYGVTDVGDLVTIKTDGTGFRTVGETGIQPINEHLGSVIDPESGKMYLTAQPDYGEGALYEVDLTTGAATLLKSFADADKITSLYIPFRPADGAPGAPVNALLTFEDGALEGFLDFDIPATLAGGAAASGECGWTLTVNDEAASEGSAAYGSHVRQAMTVPAAGNYSFCLTLHNAAGNSEDFTDSRFVGNDTPVAPAPQAEQNGRNVTISWSPVTAGIAGGNFDPSAVVYDVVRIPDGKAVATATNAVSVTDELPDAEGYHVYQYDVTASFRGMRSATARTYAVTTGTVPLPYEQFFTSPDAAADYVIIDANNDGFTWRYDSHNGNVMVCDYNHDGKTAANDWFISPAVHLVPGMEYNVEADMRSAFDQCTERFEIKLLRKPAPEAAALTVVEPTNLLHIDLRHYGSYISVEEEGDYYVGVHAISLRDKYWPGVGAVRVSEGLAEGAPEAPSAFTATPDELGDLSVEIALTAPTADIKGNALTSIDRIDILRGDNVVKSFANPAPGAALSFTDTPAKGGVLEWTAVAYCGNTPGRKVRISAFTGTHVTEDVTHLRLSEDQTAPGRVTLSWTAPSKDTEGRSVKPENLRYRVLDQNYNLIAFDTPQTSITFQAVPDGTQDFMAYAVFVSTEGGVSDGALTQMFPIGNPFTLPWSESFANGSCEGLINSEVESGADDLEWSLFNDSFSEDTRSADGDNGYSGFNARRAGDALRLNTGKFSLAGTSHPVFSFMTYNLLGADPTKRDINELEVFVREAGTSAWTSLKRGTVDELCGGVASDWSRITVPLDDYIGKNVQLSIVATCRRYNFTFIDAVKVYDRPACNVALMSAEAPAKVRPNTEFAVAGRVENLGSQTVSSLTINLFEGDETSPVASITKENLEPGANTSYRFPITFNMASDTEHAYRVSVSAAGDSNAADNESSPLMVQMVYPQLPAPTDLAAVRDGSDMILSWQQPDLSLIPNYSTEGFEDMEPFGYDGFGKWKVYDLDQAMAGGINGVDIPGLEGRPASFFIFDAESLNIVSDNNYAAHSGSKQIASIVRYDDKKSNDWLVSPRLSGKAQTISFFARSQTGVYPESFRVLTSSDGDAVEDFTEIDNIECVPTLWTRYEYDLPAGTNYFAVNCCSDGAFILFLDDFTFEDADAPASDAQLDGYRLYCDKVPMLGSLIGETQYRTPAVGFPHTYCVTAVFSGEESAPSNTVSILTMVDELDADADAAEYFTLDGISLGNRRPARGTVCIEKRGTRARKIVVK